MQSSAVMKFPTPEGAKKGSGRHFMFIDQLQLVSMCLRTGQHYKTNGVISRDFEHDAWSLRVEDAPCRLSNHITYITVSLPAKCMDERCGRYPNKLKNLSPFIQANRQLHTAN